MAEKESPESQEPQLIEDLRLAHERKLAEIAKYRRPRPKSKQKAVSMAIAKELKEQPFTPGAKYVPHHGIYRLPAGWWGTMYPRGFDMAKEGDVLHLKAWGITSVIKYGGKGTPIQIQTAEQARGNMAWHDVPKENMPDCPTYAKALCFTGTPYRKDPNDRRGPRPKLIIEDGVVKEDTGKAWVNLRSADVRDYLTIPRLTGG